MKKIFPIFFPSFLGVFVIQNGLRVEKMVGALGAP